MVCFFMILFELMEDLNESILRTGNMCGLNKILNCLRIHVNDQQMDRAIRLSDFTLDWKFNSIRIYFGSEHN